LWEPVNAYRSEISLQNGQGKTNNRRAAVFMHKRPPIRRWSLGKLASIIHPYPTQAEGLRQSGDAYNRTRLAPTVKKWAAGWPGEGAEGL
jgi:hypothetical protein